jgi:hypothetical protein
MIRKVICVLASVCAAFPTHGLRDAMEQAYVPDFDQTDIFREFSHGSLGVYPSP